MLIMARDHLGEGHVVSHAPRHTNLIATDRGVPCDDCSSRKIAALAHQVAPHTALLPLDALTKRFDSLAIAVLALGLSSNLIVEHCIDVILQQHLTLANHRRSKPCLLVVPEGNVCLHGVTELEGNVIFAPHPIVRYHSRPHVGCRDGEHSDDHPVGPRKTGVQAQLLAVGIGNAAQHLMRLLRKHLSLPNHVRIHPLRVVAVALLWGRVLDLEV
mmetsp:Transcript_14945/g.34483  ORF Transcript_14945/g.34483 Transcript_14945/m.34483 type:complete len:215 (+) Transcript_14945:2467-3111(+)